MSNYNSWVTPLKRQYTEDLLTGGKVEYEEIDCGCDVLSSLLYTLFQENWQQVELGHVVQGGVLELGFTTPPKICILYDGYLTVVTEAWHLHLCIDENLGGPNNQTPLELRRQRRVSRAAFYRRFNKYGKPRSWGIEFWNGHNENVMTVFLPNPLVDGENLLPESHSNLSKLALYQDLREIYVLGNQPMPFTQNPLKRSYISVCTSKRCLSSRNWQPTYEALKNAVEKANLDIEVRTSGCLEVCKLGPVVFNSKDRTWYTRVKPEIAEEIVAEHLVQGNKVTEYIYPSESV